MVYLQQHAFQWDDEQWAQRRDRVLLELVALEADLRARGETFGDYGWMWTPNGLWYRVGEETPTLSLSENHRVVLETLAEVAQVCPGGAIPWARVHRPELWGAAETAILCLDEVVDNPESLSVIATAVVESFADIARVYAEGGERHT